MQKLAVFRAAVFAPFILAACQSETQEANSPSKTTVVSPGELRALYAGKTWDWGNGAAYFAESGDFSAWTEAGNKPSYATGFWWADDQGRVCFDGDWRAKDGVNSRITCFGHREDGKTLYQRREPSGDWYVFESDPAQSNDEYAKLQQTDKFESKLQQVKSEVGSTPKTMSSSGKQG